MWRRVALLALAGCFKPDLGVAPFKCGVAPDECPPSYSCGTDGVCRAAPGSGGPDARPADAQILAADARPSTTPDAAPCTNTGLHCSGDTLVDCEGGVATSTPCAGGCDAAAVPNACIVIAPLEVADACATPGSGTFAPSGTIDTAVCAGGTIVQRANGLPDLCVRKAADVTLEAGVTVTLVGTRVPVVIATHLMTIAGTIDAGAHKIAGGPGAKASSLGDADTASGGGAAGSGGGGHATAGGNGGAFMAGDPAPGGPGFTGDALALAAPGGDGGGSVGGGGGGAVVLISCGAMKVAGTAVIDAGGGGGLGGTKDLLGGSGGGAGGTIRLEAATIAFTSGAVLAANGGGGGGAATDISSTPAEGGADGTTTISPATGGHGDPVGGGNGGSGGALAAPTPGDPNLLVGVGSGGGGGAAGVIQINTRADTPPTLNGVILSPGPAIGHVARRPSD